MKRRDFIKGLSAACLGASLVRGSLELEPSDTQVTKPVEQHYLGRGTRVTVSPCLDEFAFISTEMFDKVVAGFSAS